MTTRGRAVLGWLRGLTATADAEDVSAVVADQVKRGEFVAARRTASRGLRRNPDYLDLRDQLIGVLDYLGEGDAAFSLCLENAEVRAADFAARRDRRVRRRSLKPHQRVFVAGFFYSGSGAVVEYLEDFHNAMKWTRGGELRLIKGPGGMADMARRCRENGGLCKQDLVDHYLNIVGGKVRIVPPRTYDKWKRANTIHRRLMADDSAYGFLRVALSAFLKTAQRLEAGDQVNEARLERRFRRVMERGLDYAATDAAVEMLVVDQAVPAHWLRLARYAPPSRFVVVHRDPRDQFSEAKPVLERPGWKATTASEFAARYRRRREQATRMIPKLERDLGHEVLELSFEEFVAEHSSTAAKLHDFLDFPGSGRPPPEERKFRPELSRANVGKHKDLLPQEEVDVLKVELPEYLNSLADPR